MRFHVRGFVKKEYFFVTSFSFHGIACCHARLYFRFFRLQKRGRCAELVSASLPCTFCSRFNILCVPLSAVMFPSTSFARSKDFVRRVSSAFVRKEFRHFDPYKAREKSLRIDIVNAKSGDLFLWSSLHYYYDASVAPCFAEATRRRVALPSERQPDRIILAGRSAGWACTFCSATRESLSKTIGLQLVNLSPVIPTKTGSHTRQLDIL